MEHLLWTEKYRPRTFDDIIGQDAIISRIRMFISSKNMPHLLFAGPPGVGKTTTALACSRELYGENWKSNFLELNASDERGIDVVRNKVKDFARTRALSDAPFKIIYLDEADALTREAQQALRRTMENYTNTCRFILACNYSSKIIEPIQSRCAIFRFKPLTDADIESLIDHVTKKEGVTITDEGKEVLVELSEGDCRRVENLLQSSATVARTVTPDVLYSIAAIARPQEVAKILETAFKGDFLGARKQLLDVMYGYGLSGFDMVRQIHKALLEAKIDSRLRVELIDRLSEAEYRVVEGSDEYLQLEGFLAVVVKRAEK
jgi:replication factor C small subunit